MQQHELVAMATAYPKLLALLRDARLRISSMDPLALRIDDVLYVNDKHAECQRLLAQVWLDS